MKNQQQIDVEQSSTIKRLSFGLVLIGFLVLYLLASNHNNVSNKGFEEFKELTKGINSQELSHAIKEARAEDDLIHGWARGLIDRCDKSMKRNPKDDDCVKKIMKDGKHFNDRNYWIKEGYPLKK